MVALLGFAVGYYLGSKAGPEGLEELRVAWKSIKESKEFQGLAATGTSVLGDLAKQGISGGLKSLASAAIDVLGAAGGRSRE